MFLLRNSSAFHDRKLHAKNEYAQFFAHALSSRAVQMPRKPRRIQLESRLVPANDSLPLDEDQSLLPSRSEPLQHHPEQFVSKNKSRLRSTLIQHGELLPKSQVLQEQVAVGTKGANSNGGQKPQQTQHETDSTRSQAKLNEPLIYLI